MAFCGVVLPGLLKTLNPGWTICLSLWSIESLALGTHQLEGWVIFFTASSTSLATLALSSSESFSNASLKNVVISIFALSESESDLSWLVSILISSSRLTNLECFWFPSLAFSSCCCCCCSCNLFFSSSIFFFSSSNFFLSSSNACFSCSWRCFSSSSAFLSSSAFFFSSSALRLFSSHCLANFSIFFFSVSIFLASSWASKIEQSGLSLLGANKYLFNTDISTQSYQLKGTVIEFPEEEEEESWWAVVICWSR